MKKSLEHLAGNNTEKKISNLELFLEDDSKEKEDIVDVQLKNKEIKIATKYEKILKKEDKKPKKTGTMIYLDEETLSQFKTLSMIFKLNGVSNNSVTKLIEKACKEFIKGQEIDEELVYEYDRVNGNKGRRKNNK